MTNEQLTKVRDALGVFEPFERKHTNLIEALDILDAELAKPEPEPVGEVVRYIFGTHEGIRFSILPAGMLLQIGTKLYTAPPAAKEWVGLTDEEIQPINITYGFQDRFTGYARAIEAALKEKNHG